MRKSIHGTMYSKLIIVFLLNFCYSQEFKGFDDTILYKINWPGKDVTDRLAKEQDENTLNVITAIGESYQCFLPKQDKVHKEPDTTYNGPSPLELLSPLFTKQACSYRGDTYWNYEVCHGRHVRQYHNDPEEKDQKEEEYFLGKWKMIDSLKLEEELKRLANLNHPGPTMTRKVEGVNLPYFKMSMSDGTVCDLSGQPRQTNVLYVCYPQRKHNVFSVKETSICQYEVIILSSFLCTHPWYKPPISDELNIDCLPIGDSMSKPHNLKVLHSDTSKLKNQIKILTNGETKIQDKIQPNKESELHFLKEDSLLTHSKTPNNEIEKYVKGDLCLYEGSGWWKYEICYNKYIRQVHKEKGKPDEIVVLGMLNIDEHIKWVFQNPQKKLKLDAFGKKRVVSHFYSSGSVCQKTGDKRETEVRYKCVKGQYNKETVVLYLLEPKTCKYILIIESPSLCEIINGPMDEYGIFNIKPLYDIENIKMNTPFQTQMLDITEQYFEENKKKDTIPPVEQETEVSNDKKKMMKIEL